MQVLRDCELMRICLILDAAQEQADYLYQQEWELCRAQ